MNQSLSWIGLGLGTWVLAACSPGPEALPEPAKASPPASEPALPQASAAHSEPAALQLPTRAPDLLVPESTAEERDERRRARTRKLFGTVMESLAAASEAYEEHDQLEESAWFGRDQEDNRERIDSILDDAIEALGVSEVETTRAQLRELAAQRQEFEARRLSALEKRVGAPLKEELNQLERAYRTSREDYDQSVLEAEQGIAACKEQTLELQKAFVREMGEIGVKLDLASAQSLLSTVTGDDFVEMCVVFDNVRGVTLQLQELTEESGESLGAARRYYGSYVVLMRLMDKLQRDFVRRSTQQMIPGLERLAQDAELLIDEARENMAHGGNRAIGEQNIRSNELTIQATGFYVEYLRQQAAEIQARNDELRVGLRDAQNTYDTVALSSEVATLLSEGQRNFAALMKLELPDLRGFENTQMRAEFERLTNRMLQLN